MSSAYERALERRYERRLRLNDPVKARRLSPTFEDVSFALVAFIRELIAIFLPLCSFFKEFAVQRSLKVE